MAESTPTVGRVDLRLLGAWSLRVDQAEVTSVAEGSRRLVAFVAINGRCSRRRAAGALWPGADESRGSSSLRTCLWRLGRLRGRLLLEELGDLKLRPDVDVDVCRLRALSHELAIDGSWEPVGVDLTRDLLPEWSDDWLVFDRERLHQLRLHVLETLCLRLIDLGRYADAIDVALVAVASDPFRESSRQVLIRAHLAEGNTVEAVRAFRSFARLLNREMGLEPSMRLSAMLEGS